MKRQLYSGFTIIEILVVITIVAMLAVGALLLFQKVNQNVRDGKRISDINSARAALELWLAQGNATPNFNSQGGDCNLAVGAGAAFPSGRFPSPAPGQYYWCWNYPGQKVCVVASHIESPANANCGGGCAPCSGTGCPFYCAFTNPAD